MKKLALLLLITFSGVAQIVPPTTVFTRDFLRSANQTEARDKLGITGQGAGEGSYTSVATIADLPALARTNGLPRFAFTRGFASDGDRGGALYQWVNSTASTNIYRIAANGGGRWIEVDYLQRNFCNVLKAGATPFDSTDDTAAIQRAFDAAAQQSTGSSLSNLGDEPTIYFPSGRYTISGSISYGPASRGYANISIIGDGMGVTTIIRDQQGFTPVFYIQNVKLDIRGIAIRNNASGSALGSGNPNPDYNFGTAIHTVDCDYGKIDQVKISGFSRGVVLDNPSENWNTLTGLQFESNYIDIFSAAGQGSTVELHSTGSCHVWFGPANGCLIDGHYEAAGNHSEFIKTGIWIPSGNDVHVRMGYDESSQWFAWLGVPLTNRVTMSVANQTNVTLTFTNGHYYSPGYTFTLTPETSVPSDIANAIAGTLTVSSGNRTNNYVQFNSSSPITSNPAGYTFLMVSEYGMGVANATITGRGMGNYAQQKHTMMDLVRNIRVFGESGQAIKTTDRSVAVSAEGIDYQAITWTSSAWTSLSMPGEVLNIFPDPTFKAGTNWINGSVTVIANCAVVPTNINGLNGMLYYVTAKPSSLYAQYRADFKPTVPLSSLGGKRLRVMASVIELNYPIYVPTAFSINSGGSGYVNGTATVSHGGRTVEVTLTTSGGAITAAAWRFGAFVTNVGISNLPVVQGSATGGAITPTTFANRTPEVYADNGTTRAPSLSLMYNGESPPGTLGQPSASWVRWKNQDGTVGNIAISPLSNPVDQSKTALRLYFSDTSLDSTFATGCEAIFVPYVAVLVEPASFALADYIRRPFIRNATESVLSLTALGGSGWPGAAPASSASIYSQLAGGIPGIRLINPNGVSGWLFHLLPDATSDPANASPGAIYFNTSSGVWRIFTGSSWRNW
jgi:hypothetical protein